MPNIEIRMPSGSMKTELLIPAGIGQFAAVLLFVDGGGLRPSIVAIGERIATMGYLVAIPDLFFRSGSPMDLLPRGTRREMKNFEGLFVDAESRHAFFSKYYSPAIDYAHLREDVTAVLALLQKRADFNGKVGTTGYCMGGNASLRIASLFGTTIAIAASFHGGGLVTDQSDSPHLRAKDIRAKVYVAGAIEDPSFPEPAKATLIEAFKNARVDATVETYSARHGFAVEDHSTYNAAATQRHDEALAALFDAHLK